MSEIYEHWGIVNEAKTGVEVVERGSCWYVVGDRKIEPQISQGGIEQRNNGDNYIHDDRNRAAFR